MAGGVGSRFWPLSTAELPKQFLDILGTGKTFIRQTFERFIAIAPAENFLVLTNIIYKDIVLEQLPEITEKQILCEPCRRNTAPCILYAAFRIAAQNPNANMIITPSDHLVTAELEFTKVIQNSLDFIADRSVLMTIGIKPSRPETGYGYIQINDDINDGGIVKVKTFTEKPSTDLAKAFVECGEFLWNSGIFIWNVKTILSAFKQFQPDLYSIFEDGEELFNSDDEQPFINEIFPTCQNVSIDYGIMEHSKDVFVHVADFGWSDIGTWGSLYENSVKDIDGNSVVGNNVHCFEMENSIVRQSSNKVVVIEGLKDYIVVDNDKALLICSKNNEQKIRYYIENIK